MGNVRWRGYDHPEMYDMINSGPGAEASTPVTTYWEGLSTELDGINTDLNDGLSKLKVNWEGDAADSAQGGLNPLQQWSQDAQTGADIMRISSVDQAQYVSTARSSMPEPVQVTTPAPSTWDKIKAGGAAALGISGPANEVAQQSHDHEAQEAAQNAAAQKAVQTMDSYQSSSEWNSNSLGTFVPSPDVVVSVNPESSVAGKHVQNHTVNTPDNSGTTGGTTHASGYIQPNGPTNGIPNNPTLNQPNAPVQSTPTPPVQTTPTPPVQTTSPNWATPPTSTNPTNPANPVPNGPNGGGNQPFPNGSNPGNGNTGNPNLPGGRGPITGPVNGEPGENPVRTNPNAPGGRGGLGPNGEGPNGANRGGVPRGGVPGGGLNEQTRNPNSRLRPGSGPSALEEGGRGGGRANIGARSASAYNYGEGPNGARGGVAGEPGAGARGGAGGAGRGGVGGTGGAGGRGGAAEGTRGGNRFIRNANAAMEAEERLGGRGGNAGANGSKGSGGRMGRGQRGEDEEDYEYQHADYLVDTEDVFLDDRLVAPPVIGDKSGGA